MTKFGNPDTDYIKIQKELASGAFGIVNFYYLKENPDKLYIIKKISYKRHKKEGEFNIPEKKIDAYTRLINEIKSLKKTSKNNCEIDNPVDLCYIESLMDDENVYIVTKFKNDTIGLDQILNNKNIIMTFDMVKKNVLILLKKLKIIHDLNIIHNDIKPANILVQYKDDKILDLSIIDYGESCFCDDDQTCIHSGTVQYQPPDITKYAKNECSLSFYNDIYSLGVVILEILENYNVKNTVFEDFINNRMVELDMYKNSYNVEFLTKIIKDIETEKFI